MPSRRRLFLFTLTLGLLEDPFCEEIMTEIAFESDFFRPLSGGFFPPGVSLIVAAL
jgi:hypothetical protein